MTLSVSICCSQDEVHHQSEYRKSNLAERQDRAVVYFLYAFQVYHPNISSATGFICLDLLGAG